eukprot:5082638-Amphidinium_carterae.1
MRAILLGCSFTWEDFLEQAGLCPRHVQEGHNVPMFNTSIDLHRVGRFGGQMVVSMRPYSPSEIDRVRSITAAYPAAHGAPIHVGNPEAIGVQNCSTPDYGEAVQIFDGEVPVFWACGVTPQNALRKAKLPLAITHAPGHMFLADIRCEELASWHPLESKA